jgi:alpha-beta hydrolase superfamily lysophospholipase
MKKNDAGYFIAAGGTRLFYRYHDPGDAAKTLIVLHGHGEHSGRYEKFFAHLESLNIAVGVFDFRGHGRSEGAEVFVESFEQYLSDVTSFADFLAKRYHASSPVYLLGHSAGGLAAVGWALAYPSRVKKLILSAPLFGLRVPGILLRINAWLNGYFPRFIYQNPVYPRHLTHDLREVARYQSDPFIQRKISVRLVSEMLSYASRLERIQCLEVPFPVCGLLAGDERIVDNAKTKLFFGKLKSPGVRIETFPGFYHEIFNEIEQDRVFQYLCDFLSD